MKKNAKTLILLSAVLIICIGTYIGVTVSKATLAQTDEPDSALIYPAAFGAPVTVAYTVGDTSLSFDLEDGVWVVHDDRDFPLMQTTLMSLAATLESLTAIRSFEPTSDLSVYGLAEPSCTITAADDIGSSITLRIGAQSGDNLYAMTDIDTRIMTISSALIGNLEPELLNLIVLDTLPSLREATVDTITLKSASLALTLDKHTEKDGSFTWYIIEDTTYTSADDFDQPEGSSRSAAKIVSDAVAALGSTSFSSCAAFSPGDDTLGSFGLDDTKTTMTVDYSTTDSYNKTTSYSVVIDIGLALEDERGYYAALPGSMQVNLLPVTAVEPLFEALDLLGSAE